MPFHGYPLTLSSISSTYPATSQCDATPYFAVRAWMIVVTGGDGLAYGSFDGVSDHVTCGGNMQGLGFTATSSRMWWRLASGTSITMMVTASSETT